MKSRTVISKFKKIGIEFTREGNKFTGKSKTQIITFSDQNGDAVCLGTSDIATNEQDRLDMLYQDIGYKTYHESAKSAVEWVQDEDNKIK